MFKKQVNSMLALSIIVAASLFAARPAEAVQNLQKIKNASVDYYSSASGRKFSASCSEAYFSFMEGGTGSGLQVEAQICHIDCREKKSSPYADIQATCTHVKLQTDKDKKKESLYVNNLEIKNFKYDLDYSQGNGGFVYTIDWEDPRGLDITGDFIITYDTKGTHYVSGNWKINYSEKHTSYSKTFDEYRFAASLR